MTGMLTFVILGLMTLTCTCQQCGRNIIPVPQSAIKLLFDLIVKSQVQTETSEVSGQTKIQSKGSYKSVIKINSFGDSLQTAQRWAININDVNVFVPMWVSIVILEAHRYGAAPRPSDEQLISAVDFCSQFMDTSKPYNSSLVYFWKCVFDETSQRCTTRLSGYLQMLNLVKSTTDGAASQNNIGAMNLQTLLRTFSEIVNIVTGVDNIGDLILIAMQEFENDNLSPDADDTAVWLTLGSMLRIFDDEFLPVSNKWIQYNSNISSFFTAIKQFVYRPFSPDPVASTIDPQSYFVLRQFLDDAEAAGKDVALVTTWFTNANEERARGGPFRFHKIINDVDLTACANVINAMTATILSGLVSPEVLQEPELSTIYLSTSEMISYLINSNLSNRPDLALPYYPSRYQFYWSVARTVSIMDSYKRKAPLPLDVMELVFTTLRQAMDGEATRFLISAAKPNDDGSMYFDDFLGNGDVTDDNKPITRGEDRIFTTAMAANVLMYTWLSFDSDSKISQWRPETPEIVKETVDGCIMWLLMNAFSGQFKPWNVIFSTNNKGTQILPFRYPANLFIEIPQPYPFQYTTALHTKVGMQGYIPKSDYEAMINENHFGIPTPTVFRGFNDPDYDGKMAFWSSDAYTYAVTLLALSRYNKITNDSEC